MDKKNFNTKKVNIHKNTNYKQNGYIFSNNCINYNIQNNPFRNNIIPTPSKRNVYFATNYINYANNNFSVKPKIELKPKINNNNILSTPYLQQNDNRNAITRYCSFISSQSCQSINSLYSNNSTNSIFYPNDTITIIPNKLVNICPLINNPKNNLMNSNNNKLIKENNFTEHNNINKKEKNNIECHNKNIINGSSNFTFNKEKENLRKSKNKFDANNKDNESDKNIVILILVVKIGKNDKRLFYLKKFDNLFEKFQQFIDMNKISQKLTKPLISKIFSALDYVFSVLNNKIGKYDIKYLRSLHNLWLKNNKEIPKNFSDKSTTNSSHSSHLSSDSSYEDIKSKSYQNSDGNSSDEKRKTTSKSF